MENLGGLTVVAVVALIVVMVVAVQWEYPL
jgi:hypothetical protein